MLHQVTCGRSSSFPVPPRNSRILAMCPIIQFRHYVKIASGPTGEESYMMAPYSTLHDNLKSRFPPVLLMHWVKIGGSNDTLLGFNMLDLLSEIRNTFGLIDYQFITKEHNSEKPGKDTLRAIWGKDTELPRSPQAQHYPQIYIQFIDEEPF